MRQAVSTQAHEIRINSCFTEARSLLSGKNSSSKWHREAATLPLICCSWAGSAPPQLCPLCCLAPCPPALCEPGMLLRTYEVPADWGSLHLASPQSLSFHPTENKGGVYVFVRIFLVLLSFPFHYWSPASAMLSLGVCEAIFAHRGSWHMFWSLS